VTDLLRVLTDMRSGKVAIDCNQKFNEVLKAVLETGGNGKLTIELTMLEVARDLSASSDVNFQSGIRLDNGSIQFGYTEEIKGSFGRDKLEVPERFTVSIPVYVGSERVSMVARLRYRIADGKLTFWYDLLRAEAVEREGFLTTHRAIAQTLAITIINGSPA